MKGRIRRIAIVALARKLLVALWRYLEAGLVPRGAVASGSPTGFIACRPVSMVTHQAIENTWDIEIGLAIRFIFCQMISI